MKLTGSLGGHDIVMLGFWTDIQVLNAAHDCDAGFVLKD